jgi:hypothetical protein
MVFIIMPPRDDLFIKFGPLLLEAMFLVLLDEINTLRPGQGQPTITMEDLISNANNHVTTLPDYDWMAMPPE